MRAVWAAVLCLAACGGGGGDDIDGAVGRDGVAVDARRGVDGSALDGAGSDGPRLDGARLDGARADGGAPDAGRADGGAPDGALVVDAGGPCTAPWPTTAPNPLLVSGAVIDPFGGAVADALVEAVRASDGVVEATATSAADGAFAHSIATTGTAVDRYARVTKAGSVTTYAWPPYPPFENVTGQLVPHVTTGERTTFGIFTGTTNDPASGLLLVSVLDCAGNPVAGATVSSLPAAAAIRYDNGAGIPDPAATSTSTTGRAYLINVAPGAVDVSINVAGTTYRPRTVTSVANALTVSSRLP